MRIVMIWSSIIQKYQLYVFCDLEAEANISKNPACRLRHVGFRLDYGDLP